MSRPDVGSLVRHAAQAADRRAAGLRSKRVMIEKFRVRFEEGGVGAGPTVLMLHGFSADRDVWSRFAGRLKDHHVLVPELPGHGGTIPFVAGGDYSAAAQARRMVDFLDRLQVDRAHVIGNSMGGFVAAALALLAPERVATLGLVDATGVWSPNRNRMNDLLEGGENPFLITEPRQFADFYAMTMAKPPFAPRFALQSVARDYVARREQYAEIFDDFHGQGFLEERLHEISAPTWVAWGMQDQLVEAGAAQVWADGIPDATLTTYDDLGHMPMMESPRRVAADYRAFLAAHR